MIIIIVSTTIAVSSPAVAGLLPRVIVCAGGVRHHQRGALELHAPSRPAMPEHPAAAAHARDNEAQHRHDEEPRPDMIERNPGRRGVSIVPASAKSVPDYTAVIRLQSLHWNELSGII